jgi:hypothetical protein
VTETTEAMPARVQASFDRQGMMTAVTGRPGISG